MAKFRFSLATLLRLREAARDERRAQLAQAFRADELLEQQKHAAQAALAEMWDQARRAAGPGEVDVDRLIEARRFELVLLAHTQHLAHQQELVRREIERRRQALVEANREVRILERLRARQWERHRAEQNRLEIQQLDEAALRQACGEPQP